MPGFLRPQFYITRPNGDHVALLPLDEIPTNVSVGGMGRTLSTQDINGMHCVGGVDIRPGQYFTVGRHSPPAFEKAHTYFPSNQTFKQTALNHFSNYPRGPYEDLSSHFEPTQATTFNHFGSPNVDTHTKKMMPPLSVLSGPGFFTVPSTFPSHTHIMETPPSSPEKTALTTTQPQAHPVNHSKENHIGTRTIAATPSIRLNTFSPLGPSSPPIPLTGKKEYCSYWLRHGECDYQQQGCLYKHEMPTDMATLSRLGLREIPRWYREAHNLSASSFSPLNTNANGLTRSRWAPGNPGFSSRGGAGLGRESWRGHAERAMSSSSRGPGPSPLSVSVSSPKCQFILPTPPVSPPESPPNVKPNAPTPASSNPKDTPPTNPRLGVRITQQRARTAASAKAAAAPTGKPTVKAEKADKHVRGKTVSVEPDPLPNYPSLAPMKRVECVSAGAGAII